MFRVAIDTGGTFTDFIAIEGNGQIRMLKVLTSSEDPAATIMAGLKEMAANWNLNLQVFLDRTSQIVHGTTLALNALLEQKGARTALLATEGFRDALEMRRSRRDEQWDLRAQVAPVLVPRRLRIGIRERLDYRGKVLTPLDEKQVREVARRLNENGVESVAICFLFSFINPTHEEKTASILRGLLPHVFITRSSELVPLIREYERTSTSVLNAYLTPVFADYLSRFEKELHRYGWQHPIYLSMNSGGLSAARTVKSRAVKALLSGPAGGAKGGQILAHTLRRPNLILADMGGTSFDVSLVVNGSPRTTPEAGIAGYPVTLPMMDIRSVGAGGGSIATVDESKRLRIGPRSAGSFPGPVCYGNGGFEVTVTDAVLVLGLLNPQKFMGGKLRLDTEKAQAAVSKRIAAPLGLTTEEAALAVYRIIAAKMADTVRLITVQQGLDPRRFTLVAAGGAFPLFAALIAAELEMAEVIIPWHGPVFCAWGMLGAPCQVDLVKSCPMRQNAWNAGHLSAVIEKTLQQGFRELEGLGIAMDQRETELTLEIKYTDQHHEISIGIEGPPATLLTPDIIDAAFHRRHRKLYGYAEPGKPWEIVNLRVVCREKVKPLALPQLHLSNEHRSLRRRDVLLDSSGKCPVGVYDAETLPSTARGPALFELPYTTVFVPPGFIVDIHPQGFISLRQEDAG